MNRLLVFAGFMLLTACSGEQQTQSTDQKSRLEKTVEPQLDALEKAKRVEDVLEQKKQEYDKRMSEQGI